MKSEKLRMRFGAVLALVLLLPPLVRANGVKVGFRSESAGFNYDAETGTFSMDAEIILGVKDPPGWLGGPPDDRATALMDVSVQFRPDGSVESGTFSVTQIDNGFGNPPLSGPVTLMTGVVTSFNYYQTGDSSNAYSFGVDVTGGAVAPEVRGRETMVEARSTGEFYTDFDRSKSSAGIVETSVQAGMHVPDGNASSLCLLFASLALLGLLKIPGIRQVIVS